MSGDVKKGTSSTESPLMNVEVKKGFGDWLRVKREEMSITQIDLSRRSGITNVTISNIETGRTQNPTASTRKILVDTLNLFNAERTAHAGNEQVTVKEEDAEVAAEEESRQLGVPGLGSLEAFDPYAPETIPEVKGVYVLYDISERPIYVGRSKNVRRRIKNHSDRFWFKQPIVVTGYFLAVDDADLRNQIEKILIRFMRSNAVVNKVYVDREMEEEDI